jgi:hypothetical protein
MICSRKISIKLLFLNLAYFISFIGHAQLFQPIIETITQLKDTGYYFMVPYRINFSIKDFNTINNQYIINTFGEIVFFRKTQFGSDFKIQPNGVISYWHGNKFYLLNKHFQIFDSVACVNDLETDSHDFKILSNGHYLLCGKENEVRDLSHLKLFTKEHLAGSKNAIVKYDVIQELDANKRLVFEWKTKPFYDLVNINPVYLTDTATLDVTHFNSLDVDLVGNLLISFRYFDEVVKIDRRTGLIIWRMGGKYNQIDILNDSIPFLGQHDAQYTGFNTISVFDNGYSFDSLQHNARGLEYEIDDDHKTAKLIWHYSKNNVVSLASGSVKRYQDGLTLLNYGKIHKSKINITAELINSKNEVLQIIKFKDTLGSYRTFYYSKLPFKLKKEPIIITKYDGVYVLATKRRFKYYLWSTGEDTHEISVTKLDRQCVFVSDDGINYTRSESLKDQ